MSKISEICVELLTKEDWMPLFYANVAIQDDSFITEVFHRLRHMGVIVKDLPAERHLVLAIIKDTIAHTKKPRIKAPAPMEDQEPELFWSEELAEFEALRTPNLVDLLLSTEAIVSEEINLNLTK